MATVTSVGITSGVPSSGTGNVSTIDQLINVGSPISNGSTSAPATVAITGNASVATSTMSALVVNISSNSAPHTVVPSSAVQVTLTSNTVALSSNPTVILSSNPTVILSSNPTITSLSSGAVSVTFGSNTATVVAGSSAVTSTMSALVVALSTLGPLQANVTGSSQVLIIGGSAQQNTAFVLSGSSTVTSTMASLVVALSSNGAGIIGTGTPTSPSSQYISAVVQGDLAIGAANSSASNPVPVGGTVVVGSYLTAASSFQRIEAIFDPLGKQITVNSARALKGNQITYISSTTETNVVAASSLFFQDLYGFIVANPSSQAVTVTVKDSSGGTTQFSVVCPSADTRGFLGTESAAFKQTTSSAAWTATLSVAASSVAINALFVKNTA